jgi:GTPase
MGPTVEGVFKAVQIKSIHFLPWDVNEIYCGNSCPINLRSLDKNFELTTQNFIKGMVLVSENHLSLHSNLKLKLLLNIILQQYK